MSEFIFLYRSEGNAGSPEQMQQRMQNWMVWMKRLGENGHLKDPGQPLETAGKVVRAHDTITDGPYAETKDLIAGYTLIEARNLDEAAALSAGCPIFEIGGLVEVRPIIKLDL